jgi:hypothetical protein
MRRRAVQAEVNVVMLSRQADRFVFCFMAPFALSACNAAEVTNGGETGNADERDADAVHDAGADSPESGNGDSVPRPDSGEEDDFDASYKFDAWSGPSGDATFVTACDDGGYCHEPGVASCESLMTRPRPDQSCASAQGQTGFCCEPCWIPPDAGWMDICTIIGGRCTPLDVDCEPGYHNSPRECEHCDNPGRCCIPDVLPACDAGAIFPFYCKGKEIQWCDCDNGTWRCREHPEDDCKP